VATKAADIDYLVKSSETTTVSFVVFQMSSQIAPTNTSTGIYTSSGTNTIKDEDSCVTNCVPQITAVSPYTGRSGDIVTLSGENFAGATKIIFNTFTNAVTFTVVSSTSITVVVPAGLPTGETGIEVVTPKGVSPRNFDLEIIP
jgi:hypothetical protein